MKKTSLFLLFFLVLFAGSALKASMDCDICFNNYQMCYFYDECGNYAGYAISPCVPAV